MSGYLTLSEAAEYIEKKTGVAIEASALLRAGVQGLLLIAAPFSGSMRNLTNHSNIDYSGLLLVPPRHLLEIEADGKSKIDGAFSLDGKAMFAPLVIRTLDQLRVLVSALDDLARSLTSAAGPRTSAPPRDGGTLNGALKRSTSQHLSKVFGPSWVLQTPSIHYEVDIDTSNMIAAERRAQAELAKYAGPLVAELSGVARAVAAVVPPQAFGVGKNTCAVAEWNLDGYRPKEPPKSNEAKTPFYDFRAAMDRHHESIRARDRAEAVETARQIELARLKAHDEYESSKRIGQSTTPNLVLVHSVQELPVTALSASDALGESVGVVKAVARSDAHTENVKAALATLNIKLEEIPKRKHGSHSPEKAKVREICVPARMTKANFDKAWKDLNGQVDRS